MKKDIVFISFEFPPLSMGGVFRPMEFVRYLGENNIRPHVYCLSPEYYSNVYGDFKTDEALLKEISSSDFVLNPVRIDPIWPMYSSKIKRFLNIYFNTYRGNEYKVWEKYLIDKVIQDSKKVSFKCVFVTTPPFGMLKIAEQVAKKLQLPLVIDMRDAWAYWNTNGYGTYLHYLSTIGKEKRFFKSADKIIATTDQTIADWNYLHPEIPKDKFICIPNGYYAATPAPIEEHISIKPIKEVENFNIVYVGSFYYSPDARQNMLTPRMKRKGVRKLQFYPRKQDWLYRSPWFFLKAIAAVLQLNPALREKVRIVFAGRNEGWLQNMITELGLTDVTIHKGFLSHDKALQLQKDSDALLITSAKVEDGRDCFVAGKTFEYITMNKPIFSFVAEGSQKDILKPTGLSVEFDPDNIQQSANKLMEIFDNGMELKPSVSYIHQFNRKELTQKLAETIHTVTDNTI